MIFLHIAYLLFLAFMGLKALRRPGYAVALILLIFTIRQAAQIWLGTYFSTPVLYVHLPIAVVGFLSLLQARSRGMGRWRLDRPQICAMAFVAFAIGSLVWNDLHDAEFRSRVVTSLIYIVLFMGLLPSLLRSEEDIQDTLRGLVWIGSFTLFVLFMAPEWQGRGVVMGDEYSTTINPITGTGAAAVGNPLAVAKLAGNMLVLVVLLNLTILGKSWALWRWVLAAIAVAVMVRTNSRGEMGFQCLVLVGFFPFAKSFKSLKSQLWNAFGLLGVIGVLYGIYAYSVSQETQRWDQSSMAHDIAVRTDFVHDAFVRWMSSGFLHFLGGFGVDGSINYDNNLTWPWPEVGLGGVFFDLGLIGLSLWVLLLMYAGRSAINGFRLVRRDPTRRSAFITIAALAAAEFLLSFKEGGYFQAISWCMVVIGYEAILREKALAEPALTVERPLEGVEYGALATAQ